MKSKSKFFISASNDIKDKLTLKRLLSNSEKIENYKVYLVLLLECTIRLKHNILIVKDDPKSDVLYRSCQFALYKFEKYYKEIPANSEYLEKYYDKLVDEEKSFFDDVIQKINNEKITQELIIDFLKADLFISETSEEIKQTINRILNNSNTEQFDNRILKLLKLINSKNSSEDFLSINSFKKNYQIVRERYKELNSKIDEKYKFKLKFKLSIVSKLATTLPFLLIIGVYIHTRIYYSNFGLDYSRFFDISDYLSSAVNIISIGIVSAIISALSFFLGLQHSSKKIHDEYILEAITKIYACHCWPSPFFICPYDNRFRGQP